MSSSENPSAADNQQGILGSYVNLMAESGDILDQIPDGPAATRFQSARFEIISQPQTADNKITELKMLIERMRQHVKELAEQ